jgi:osmoprotectant transport system ATP-binding protein
MMPSHPGNAQAVALPLLECGSSRSGVTRIPLIRFESVSKSYDDGASYAVRDVTLRARPRTTLVLLGESGCGKTTTLKMMNRLEDPSSGRIRIDGEDIMRFDRVGLRRQIGYVFQGIGLFPHLTVAENIATVPQLLGWPRADIDKRVDELLELVGLPASRYAKRYPEALSGGQQQRIGVARALAARPRILLMDEPFGALDALTRVELQQQFLLLREQLGLTVVLVTHDVNEALLLGDLIAVMRDGQVIASGTPADMVRNAQDEFVAELMKVPLEQAARVDRLAGRAP